LLAAILGGPWLWWLLSRHRVTGAGALAAVLALLWPVHAVAWPPPEWRVVVCDVGPGDGVVIAARDRSAGVSDGGPEPASMSSCLARLQVSSVDAVVLTHLHADHTGGLDRVLRGWPVGEVFISSTTEPEAAAEAIAAAVGEHGIPLREVRAGDRLTW